MWHIIRDTWLISGGMWQTKNELWDVIGELNGTSERAPGTLGTGRPLAGSPAPSGRLRRDQEGSVAWARNENGDARFPVRRGLAFSSRVSAVNLCLTDDVVAAMIEGKLEGERFSAAEEHLSSCARCMRLVEAAGDAVSSSDAARPLTRGTFVGRYEILEAVGAGGMGRVYAAWDPALDRKVALKLLRPHAAAPELEARLLREAKAMARLSQPEVITVHDVGRHGDQLFIAMEFVEGGTLRQWLAAHPRTIAEILAVFVQAARGLAASHDVGLVHRDFKPDNVLVRDDGRVLVSDFGLVRDAQRSSGTLRLEPVVPLPADETAAAPPDADPGSNLTLEGTRLGTPAYMAPEQITREWADARSDVYSFSVTLYEALYGVRPFRGATLDAILVAMKEELEFPSRTPPVPPSLTRALRDGLQLDPALRPASMREMLLRLEIPPRLRGASRAWIALALVVAALGASAAATFLAHPRVLAPSRLVADGRPRPSVAVLGVTAGARSEDAWLGFDLAEALRADLQGRDRGLRAIADDRIANVFAEAKIDPAAPLDAKTIDALRARLDTDYLVVGSVEPRGAAPRTLRAEVRLVDTERRAVVGVFREEGKEDAIADLGLSLGAAMRARVGARQVTEEEAAAVRAKVPRSTAAAKAYGQGLERAQAFDVRGARAQLESAVAIEPSFIPAHVRLALLLASVSAMKQSREESRIALSLADGLPTEERLDLEAAYRARIRDWDRAIEVARALVTFYPDDLDYGLRLAYVQIHASRFADALSTVSALHALPKPAGDDPRIDFREAEAAHRTADYARAFRAAERAGKRAEQIGSTWFAAQADYWMSLALLDQGKQDESLAKARESIRLARDSGDDWTLVASLGSAGNILTDDGLFDEAQRDFEEARALNRKIGNDVDEEVETNSLAEVADARDDVRGAAALFAEGLEASTKNGSATHRATSLCNLGMAKLELGDLHGGLALLDEAIAVFTASGEVGALTQAQSARARGIFERGETAAAVAELRAAIETWARIGDPREGALAKTTLALLLAEGERAKEAVDVAREAVGVLDANPKEGSRGSAHAALAVALLARRSSDEARAEAVAARAALARTASASERNAVGIGAGRVLAEVGGAEDRDAGMSALTDVIARSRASGRLFDELHARLALAEVEVALAHPSDARALVADAETHGFVAVARAARRLLR